MSVLKYFKNIPPSPPHRATGLKCNYFFQIRNEVPGKKKALSPPQRATGPVARGVGDRPLSPVGGGDRSPPFFFLQGLRCKFEKKKKLHIGPVAL